MEIFEKSRTRIGADTGIGYRNMVCDPVLNERALGRNYNNFCACGLAASGDELEEGDPEPVPVKSTVMKMQALQYAKNILAIIGIIVIGKFLYTNYLKK